jgi:hypothetical protein
MTETPKFNGGRFALGQTGNPAGRPRKDQSVSKAILKAASATVTVTEKGKRGKIRKLDATAAQLASKGATGDMRGKMLLDMAARAEADHGAAVPLGVKLTHTDQEIVEAFLADFRKYIEENGQ